MSFAVMPPSYDNRRSGSSAFTNCVVAGSYELSHLAAVLDKQELLAALAQKGVKNAQIEKVLDLPSSRVTEIRWATPGREPPAGRKPRELTYDEGVKLTRAFGLEPDRPVDPLPPAVTRLVVRYIAQELGAVPEDRRVRDLSEDLRAFSEYVADPRVRHNLAAAEEFFRVMHLRRPKTAGEAEQQSDPHRAQ